MSRSNIPKSRSIITAGTQQDASVAYLQDLSHGVIDFACADKQLPKQSTTFRARNHRFDSEPQHAPEANEPARLGDFVTTQFHDYPEAAHRAIISHGLVAVPLLRRGLRIASDAIMQPEEKSAVMTKARKKQKHSRDAERQKNRYGELNATDSTTWFPPAYRTIKNAENDEAASDDSEPPPNGNGHGGSSAGHGNVSSLPGPDRPTSSFHVISNLWTITNLALTAGHQLHTLWHRGGVLYDACHETCDPPKLNVRAAKLALQKARQLSGSQGNDASSQEEPPLNNDAKVHTPDMQRRIAESSHATSSPSVRSLSPEKGRRFLGPTLGDDISLDLSAHDDDSLLALPIEHEDLSFVSLIRDGISDTDNDADDGYTGELDGDDDHTDRGTELRKLQQRRGSRVPQMNSKSSCHLNANNEDARQRKLSSIVEVDEDEDEDLEARTLTGQNNTMKGHNQVKTLLEEIQQPAQLLSSTALAEGIAIFLDQVRDNKLEHPVPIVLDPLWMAVNDTTLSPLVPKSLRIALKSPEAMPMVLIPLHHLMPKHWTLLALDKSSNEDSVSPQESTDAGFRLRLRYFDTIPSETRADQVKQRLGSWLRAHALCDDVVFETSECCEQEDAHSCGPLVLLIIHELLHGQTPSSTRPSPSDARAEVLRKLQSQIELGTNLAIDRTETTTTDTNNYVRPSGEEQVPAPSPQVDPGVLVGFDVEALPGLTNVTSRKRLRTESTRPAEPQHPAPSGDIDTGPGASGPASSSADRIALLAARDQMMACLEPFKHRDGYDDSIQKLQASVVAARSRLEDRRTAQSIMVPRLENQLKLEMDALARLEQAVIEPARRLHQSANADSRSGDSADAAPDAGTASIDLASDVTNTLMRTYQEAVSKLQVLRDECSRLEAEYAQSIQLAETSVSQEEEALAVEETRREQWAEKRRKLEHALDDFASAEELGAYGRGE
ncbi:hypothetical protein LIA77_12005 [Sarocladium implicatum]|nr:hypothetical protein LIA77_12005 [Sarocladium implicatum]